MAVVERELPNEVVQRGAEVVNHVADNSAPFVRTELPEGFTVDSYLACLGIRLGLEFVRATIDDERLDSLVEKVQVHIRPVDFGPATLQRKAHGRR